MGSCQSTPKIQQSTVVTKKPQIAPELKQLQRNMLYSRRLTDSDRKCKTETELDRKLFQDENIVHLGGKSRSIQQNGYKSVLTSKTLTSNAIPKSQEI